MIAASHEDAEDHQGGVFHVDDGSPVSKSSGSDSAVGIGIGKASHNIVDNYLMVQEVVSGGDEFDGLMNHFGNHTYLRRYTIRLDGRWRNNIHI